MLLPLPTSCSCLALSTSSDSFCRRSTSCSSSVLRPVPPVSALLVGWGARPSRASRSCSSICRRFFRGTYSSYLRGHGQGKRQE